MLKRKITVTNILFAGSGLCVGWSSSIFSPPPSSFAPLSAGLGLCLGAISGVSNVAGVASGLILYLSLESVGKNLV